METNKRLFIIIIILLLFILKMSRKTKFLQNYFDEILFTVKSLIFCKIPNTFCDFFKGTGTIYDIFLQKLQYCTNKKLIVYAF